MTRTSVFPGNCEIVEIEDEPNPAEHYRSNDIPKPEIREERDIRCFTSNAGNVSSLEEDLNQLFEIFNHRASPHGSSRQNKAGTSKRNSPKKPVKSGGSHTPGHGSSERVNLKQALRGLCLSQASEMAAMKRSMKSPRSSEAERILTMYRNVVVEDDISDHSHDDSRERLLEISHVAEQSTADSSLSIQKKLPTSDLWPSNQSFQRTIMQTDRFLESSNSRNQISMSEKHACGTSLSSQTAYNSIKQVAKSGTRGSGRSSASIDSDSASQTFWTESSQTRRRASPLSSSHSSYVKNTLEITEKLPAQKVFVAAAVKAEKCNSKVDLHHQDEKAHSRCCSDTSYDKSGEHNKNVLGESLARSSSAIFLSQLPLTEPLHDERRESLHSSRDSCGKTSLDTARKMAVQKERLDTTHKEEHKPTLTPRSDHSDEVVDHIKNSTATNKVVDKEAAATSANAEVKELGGEYALDLLKIIPTGSPKGKKVSQSTGNTQHFVKPLIKTKNFAKRRSKKKMASDNSSKSVHMEINNDLYSSSHPIVCPRCQCMVTDAWKEANTEPSFSRTDSPVSLQESLVSNQESMVFYEDSPISPFASLSSEISSGNGVSGTPGASSNDSIKSKTESCSNSVERDDADFTQSSKGSPGEHSSSISISESNLGRPSFCDRPHMSKDVRWEAVRQVKFEHGPLGLKNFSLLKKLGCGDIGTVYLTELIGTNCLFAVKVMDNEFLARRKKITRAKTEKEILRMLDHPFLPTLYCQFTSDNLSCLVMEYCPGGDLHVLRQRQPGRCFTEQAARFYVAEVLLALEYLHMLGVIYRDLKPENILVREDGHIMLSDFDLSLRCAVSPTLLVSSSMSEGSRNTSHDSHRCADSRCVQPLCIEPSCQVTCFTSRHLISSSKSRKMKSDTAAEMRPLLQLVAEPTTARSNSFVGTHEYLAPEIIKGEGHGSAVDWWTYGIFLYELLYGKTPFKGAGNEETLANVVLQSLKFPDSPLVSLEARELIAALLVKEPENRLGTERGATEIKQHPFFAGMNWALIRCTVPPELPESLNYGISQENTNEKNNKNAAHSSGSGSAEHLEFEVF